MRVGVIGCGYWGPNLIRNLLENRRCESVTICDRDRESLERARQRFPHLRCLSDVDELLADPGIEAVLIATPVSTHFELASAALQSGRHTFIEKPMAASVPEAE